MSLGVLVTYHDERTLLTECLESIRSQTAAVDEVLVYDDASRYPAIGFIPSGLQVRVIRADVNRGPAYGRNRLLDESHADYVHFHDSDDLFHADWSERVRESFRSTAVDMVLTEVSFFADGRTTSERVLGLQALASSADLIRFCIQGSLLTPSGTYTRKAALKVGGYREGLWQSEDWDYHVRLAAAGVTYTILNEPLVLCRHRADGRSQNRREVFVSATQAIGLLTPEVPAPYWPDLAERAAEFGAILFQLGAREEARRAFRIARSLGPPRFTNRRALYRLLGRLLGPEVAECATAWYRRNLTANRSSTGRPRATVLVGEGSEPRR